MTTTPPGWRQLPGVTLVCIDTLNHALALRALERSRAALTFARTLFFTDALPAALSPPPGIDLVPIAPLASRDAYSRLVVKDLLPWVTTAHILLVQWDGYVIEPDAWDEAFLAVDYIGAPWFWHQDGMRVGNGGFSLRSRRLLEALQDPRIVVEGAEDETICRRFRPLLEREHGIRFADETLADRFAFETGYPVGRPFGFHGLYNFARVVPQTELAALAPQFSDAIARSPQCLQLARNARALGQWQVVAAVAARMLAANPGHAEARSLLAGAQAAGTGANVGRNDACPCGSGKRYKHCHGAPGGTTPAPTSTEMLLERALAAHRSGDLDGAESAYRAALAADAGHPLAEHFLGVIRYQRGDLTNALPLLERSAARRPDEPEFHNNLGLALAAADRIGEAIVAYRAALARNPGHAAAWNNLALALTQSNDVAAAADACRRAIALQPDFAQAHWNLALALLAQGEFAEGWREYEWRLRIPELAGTAQGPRGARWDGAPPAGRRLLLDAEQGLGDTLQFVRFAREFAARGAYVIVRAQPPLVRLVATAPGIAEVVASDAPMPPFDVQLPLLSAAGALEVRATAIPATVPYLTADPARTAALRHELARTPARLRVGLSWAGRPQHANDRRRSAPLAAFAPLFALPGVAWYSLQQRDGEDQIATVPAAQALVLHEARNDFDAKAALVMALDLVISVDTSHAHLAGALGRPVWVLLPFAPEWRWQLDRGDSPWYPTARLFRQPAPGDWAGVVAKVRAALMETMTADLHA